MILITPKLDTSHFLVTECLKKWDPNKSTLNDRPLTSTKDKVGQYPSGLFQKYD